MFNLIFSCFRHQNTSIRFEFIGYLFRYVNEKQQQPTGATKY